MLPYAKRGSKFAFGKTSGPEENFGKNLALPAKGWLDTCSG
jgi:hypothetical protein